MSYDIIKLDSNENQIKHSFDIVNCIKEIDPKLYPDVTNNLVKEEIAKHFGVTKDEVFCSHGSDYLIKALTFGLVRGNHEVIMPDIAFPTYEIAAKIKECKYIKVPLKDYGIDLKATLEKINENTRLIWISNPHNPTGTLLNDEDILSFLEKVPSYVKVVLDEAYIEFLEKDPLDSLKIYKEFSNVIILRTFSKAYGLVGVRVGYGIARPSIIDEFKFVIGPFDLNSYAQSLAVRVIKEKEYVEQVRIKNKEALHMYEATFKELNIEYIKSYASFIMFKLGEKATELVDFLQRNGIIVKDGKIIGMNGFVRISMGTEEQNRIVIDNIKKFLTHNY
ncbi:histidinol-phosphate transaminase [Clostridium tertium]|uniref:histidinol-phosphate transaminase n=1 Tax=Clostridium tertium TaxID=1559 RepID=UPI00241E187D|nr:histidinol-phosphate transaminase [Clostridium tertium]